MEQLLAFKGQAEALVEQVERGQEAAYRLGRLRRRVCRLARELDQGLYTPEQAAAVRVWLEALHPVVFGVEC